MKAKRAKTLHKHRRLIFNVIPSVFTIVGWTLMVLVLIINLPSFYGCLGSLLAGVGVGTLLGYYVMQKLTVAWLVTEGYTVKEGRGKEQEG